MRIVVWCLVVAGLGALAGGYLSHAEFTGVVERFDPNNGVGIGGSDPAERISAAMREAGTALPPTSGAVVEVANGKVHDFGSMETDSKGSHVFWLRNAGSKTLKLSKGGTSCQACTISELGRNEVPPGESGPVTISWTVSSPDLDYHKEAFITTNDPKQPTLILTIKGKVVKSVRVEDEEIKLGSVSVTDGRVGKSRIYSFRKGTLELTPPELTNAETSSLFQVDVRPLTGEELAERDGAIQGYEVAATAKPGLPLGTILQTIRLKSNWTDLEKIEIPIRGTVVSDIGILGGRNFDSHGNVFRLDVVKRDVGAKVQAQIAIKGAERHDVKLSVGEIDPASSLKATLGEPKEVNGGAVILVPITIEVPPGSPVVSRLGGAERKDYGKITIKTTHSLSKEIQLLVRFAVE